MKASLMTLVGATILTASLTGATAQVLNLTGEFQCVRLCLVGPPALAYLTQADVHSKPTNLTCYEIDRAARAADIIGCRSACRPTQIATASTPDPVLVDADFAHKATPGRRRA